MAAATLPVSNGNGHSHPSGIVEIPLKDQPDQILEIDVATLPEPAELISILESEEAAVPYWIRVANEYKRKTKVEDAIGVLLQATEAAFLRHHPSQLLTIYSLLAALYLQKARLSPKMIMQNAREDKLPPEIYIKDYWLDQATNMLNQADKADAKYGPNWVIKGTLLQTKGNLDSAVDAFNTALGINPGNLYAMLGKACCLYVKKSYRSALKQYQTVLRLAPRMMSPDPRIGIGLCFYKLGDNNKALTAFTRAAEINPENPHAKLVLGLCYVNISRDSKSMASEEERAQMFARGLELAGRAFKMKKELAMAAVVLAGLQIVKGNMSMATKLSERAIQFSTTRRSSSESYYQLARGYHSMKEYDSAARYYTLAYEASNENIPAAIGLGQMQIQRNEVQLAKVTFDNILKKDPRCIEAMTVLASLFAHFPAKSDEKAEKARAKQLYEQSIKLIADLQQNPLSARILDDPDLFVELAQVSTEESIDRGLLEYEKAREIRSGLGLPPSPEIINNIAASLHLKGDLTGAQLNYETAIAETQELAKADDSYDPDAFLTTMMYNLGRVFEDLNDLDRAKEIYDSILGRHPEYVDARIRLGCVCEAQNDPQKAHELFKEAFTKHPSDMQVRAFYGYHLGQTKSSNKNYINYLRAASEVHVNSLKEHARGGPDAYALTALGNIAMQQARDKVIEEGKVEECRKVRAEKYRRAAEYYYQALKKEPGNAYAAQGIAVLLAEDRHMASSYDGRMRDLKEAISILSRVRDILNDSSVYINLGHMYMERDESLKAIEAYEMALRKHGSDDYRILLYLAKAWEHRASTAEPSKRFGMIVTAINYTEKSLTLRPDDLSIKFNVAYLQQRAAQVMLYELQPQDRKLTELQQSVEWSEQAKMTFAELAEAKNLPPQLFKLADQRAKFGQSLVGRGPEQIKLQEEYETKIQTRQAEVRRLREEEERRKAEEGARIRAEKEEEARKLAAERQEMMAKLAEWNERREAEVNDKSDEDEEEDKALKGKRKQKESGLVA